MLVRRVRNSGPTNKVVAFVRKGWEGFWMPVRRASNAKLVSFEMSSWSSETSKMFWTRVASFLMDLTKSGIRSRLSWSLAWSCISYTKTGRSWGQVEGADSSQWIGVYNALYVGDLGSETGFHSFSSSKIWWYTLATPAVASTIFITLSMLSSTLWSLFFSKCFWLVQCSNVQTNWLHSS
jgi:hypothetical protein